MHETAAIILAAGQGSRMKSNLNKILHSLAGLEMINHVVRSVRLAAFDEVLVVIGYQGDKVREVVEGVIFVEQKEQLGTGHAVNQCLDELKNFSGPVLITYGDTPLFRPDTFKKLIQYHQERKAAATILTAKYDDPTGYGRILRSKDNTVLGVVEQKDASESQLMINEINTGTYCFDSQLLFHYLAQITPDNAQAEYYLPDVLPLMLANGHIVEGFILDDPEESMGINDRIQLTEAGLILRDRNCRYWQEQGVTIMDPSSTWIEHGCTIGQDTVIYPQSFIQSGTTIGANCSIGPNCRLSAAHIGDGVKLENAVVENRVVQAGREIVPFSFLTK